MILCRHCKQVRPKRPRGLCFSCYYKPGVRELYPSASKYCRKLEDDFSGPGAVPTPTDLLPGTEEKMDELSRRVERKERFWHPKDREWDLT